MKSTCAIAHEFPEAFLAFGLHNSSLGSGALFAAHRASLAFLDNVAGFIELRPEILRAPRLGRGRDGGRYSGSRLPARKSVVEGKGVSVRVDLGGRRIIKKKRTHDLNQDFSFNIIQQQY